MNLFNIILKIFNIVFSIAILAAFFLPWINGGSFGTLSAFETIKYSEKMGLFSNVDGDNIIYPIAVVSLCIFPICSVIIIIFEIVSLRSPRMFVPQILMFLIYAAYLIFLVLKYQEKGFELLDYGAYLTAICVFFLLIKLVVPNPKKNK